MTMQTAEFLILNESPAKMRTCPLESLFESKGIDMSAVSSVRCTSLHRGYFGTWEIKDNQLYLIGLLDACNHPFDAEALFDGRRLPIRADWFTGRLDVDRGELLASGGGWSSIYARRLFLYIENGRLIRQRNQRQIHRLRRAYDCTFQAYSDWRRDSGLPLAPSGLTAAGYAALGWPTLDGEAPWPAEDAEDDLADVFERLLPLCHRPGDTASTAAPAPH